MTFLVETGEGVTGANSYASVEFADAYFADRGVAPWELLSLEKKQQALVRGTDYVEQFYGLGWPGNAATSTQTLAWPRSYVWRMSGTYWPATAVPEPLMRAVCELALTASAGRPLAPNAGRLKKRSKVGPLEVEYESGGSPFVGYTAVSGLLNMLMGGSAASGNNRAVVRA